ncbi:MAG TPA: type II secretion system protein N [Ramlibacter sp.]|jgi:general secretion pathway protein C|uniref:type II secretion system protein N n=1 Tax=Ramlibacter sp. TaxID=1917967 RepID=UPI002D30D605|nr:type II secretion system protein N [Ramlibacter sp.]HZY19710.1 type II secretion system protein N [Ramlibacter sp.]
MVSTRGSNWTVRGVTFLLWAGAAASIGYWGLKLGADASRGPSVAAAVRPPPVADPAAVARLLGHTTGSAPVAAAPSAASRFALLGVVADRSQHGAALIAVDGRPPKPYRVGSAVDEGLVLKSVQPRRAVLAETPDGPDAVTLDLPVQPGGH